MATMTFNRDTYRDKVSACWFGKNIGGTLGAPMEWKRQVNDVHFYTQELGGEPLPNDDLDIQLLWLIALEEKGIAIDSLTLAEYWCLYVTPHWAEYGAAKIAMRAGLLPPLTGSYQNVYKHSCGAFIRSEIWACIAPGCPDIAARYAYEDAILDHGNGEGMYAEIFCAALESAAFVISDTRALIDIGLSYIPENCGVAAAVKTAVAAVDTGKDFRQARDDILTHHRGSTFQGNPNRTSPEDREKGFHEGERGYDAPSNIAIVVLGLLLGNDDFDTTLCTAVNCGEDTDCTAATVGSIYGIIHGMSGIPQKWIAPIGNTIKTACLNLGELGSLGSQLPQTIDELTDRTERIAMQTLARHRPGIVTIQANSTADTPPLSAIAFQSKDHGAFLYRNENGPRFTFDFFDVALDYGAEPTIRNGEEKIIRVTIRNTYKTQANLSLHWYLPDGWRVSPAQDGTLLSMPYFIHQERTVAFTLAADNVVNAMNRAVLELTIEGRPTVVLVPITLLNGNLIPEDSNTGTAKTPLKTSKES